MIRFYLLCVILNVFFFSCTEERFGDYTLLTEEVVNVSGERVIVLGRLLATQNVQVEDHGFYFSTDENFSDPLILSLGNTNRPGRFVGEQEGLNLGIGYFVKSFALSGSEILFGNILEFSTLIPLVERFEPTTQFAGEIITIYGRNFGEDTEVYFGEIRGLVIDVSFGFRVRVRVPPMVDDAEVPVKVVTRGREIIAEQTFRYVRGLFSRLADVPVEANFRENIYFQHEGEFYSGLGIGFSLQANADIYSYSPTNTEWRKIDFSGQTHIRAFSSLDGYFGGGYMGLNPPLYNPDFWQFDGNDFISLTPPPVSFANAICFVVRGEIYVAGGDLIVGSVLYQFSPQTNNWMVRPNLPFNVNQDLLHFTFNDLFYIIDKDKRLWEFNPLTVQSRIVATYPSPFIEGQSDFGGTVKVVGNKAYIGLYNSTRDFWELDMVGFTWSRKNFFPGEVRSFNAGIFEFDGVIYLLRSPRSSPKMEFWRFDPDAN